MKTPGRPWGSNPGGAIPWAGMPGTNGCSGMIGTTGDLVTMGGGGGLVGLAVVV